MENKYIKLGENFKITKGKKVVQLECNKEKSIRYLQIEDLRNDKNIKFCEPNEKYVIANEKNIIIAWDGANAGTINYGLRGAIGSTLAILRTDKDFNIPYIGKFLKTKTKYLRDNCSGATIPHIQRKVLENIKVPIFPLATQKKIVQVLDKAQELIDKRKEQIEKLDEFIQSVFLDMFGNPVKNPKGWEVAKLEQICNIKSGGTPSRDNPEYFKGNIPWITTPSLGKKYIDESDAVEFITEEAILNSATKLIPKESIMIGTRVGVGKVSINNCNMCTNQDILSLVQINDGISKLFLLDIFKFYGNYFESQKRGATIKGITSRIIKNLNIILPPLNLQNEFAQIVQKTEAQKELLQKSLTELENNFNSLMQRAFKGELFNS